MRILHVTLGFYPAQVWGGPVKIVYYNGRELVRRGHQVTVYCTNLLDKRHKIQPSTFERELDGMRVVYFDAWHLPWWPGTLGPFWLPDLPTYLRREIAAFDVVHLNGYRNPMMIVVARSAGRAGVPVVTQPHGTLPAMLNATWLKRFYDRLLGGMELEEVDAIIAAQDGERRQALAKGVPDARIEVIPNGIDPSALSELPLPGVFRRRLGLARERPLVLFLGRINRIKGTDMLVEAFARLQQPDAILVIAGPDDGQLSEVQRLVEQHKLRERVIFTGLLVGPDVLAAFQDADLFVLPSRSDAFPVTIMEACLVGTPMVVTDCCEIAHLVQDRVAEVVPFDAGAFAAAIDRLLVDQPRCQRYRANGPALVTGTFSLTAVVDRLETVYQRVIAAKGGG
jgi:glycosyltransferase involved in cell wall biosynthesis